MVERCFPIFFSWRVETMQILGLLFLWLFNDKAPWGQGVCGCLKEKELNQT